MYNHPFPAKRRTRAPQTLARFVVPGALWLLVAACAWAFAHLTRIALYRQAHGVIGAEHPYDWQADGCLALAMAAAALLLLTRPARRRAWRKSRFGTARRAKRRRKRVQWRHMERQRMLPPPKSVPGGAHKNTRREARELALRMLFELDLGRQPPEGVIQAALAQSPLEGANRDMAEELVRGTLAHQKEIDALVAALSTEWALDRQAAVDRNILRLATFELRYKPDVPTAGIVNEAVELAKKYSTADSGRFVNGVLGAMTRPAPAPETGPEAGDE